MTAGNDPRHLRADRRAQNEGIAGGCGENEGELLLKLSSDADVLRRNLREVRIVQPRVWGHARVWKIKVWLAVEVDRLCTFFFPRKTGGFSSDYRDRLSSESRNHVTTEVFGRVGEVRRLSAIEIDTNGSGEQT
ncbi:hypothetical protein D9V28_07805 [Mycetocola zhadangensis]|uniref:Uncharacterized protein n=1 Tax=Mycetocola zhadangensis TaxID=1164595 RepID=A0A3L7J0W1_9MICO|nr:hypothetical protein D9V28_07805 [Mycetocola zhadangensis]